MGLGGLTDDQVLWNFFGGSGGTGGPTMSLNNNASSFPLLDWQGVLLDPNGTMSLVNANLDGRVFGGDTHNMQIISNAAIDTITAPRLVPEPSTLILFGGGLALLAALRRHKTA